MKEVIFILLPIPKKEDALTMFRWSFFTIELVRRIHNQVIMEETGSFIEKIMANHFYALNI
jgi:hypothetical protein